MRNGKRVMYSTLSRNISITYTDSAQAVVCMFLGVEKTRFVFGDELECGKKVFASHASSDKVGK